MRVRVYRHLRRRVWSLQDPRTGLVVDHRPELVLLDVVLVVSEATRQRGEGWLIATLEAWAGLPRADARTLARLLVAHGSASYPLTQTETRMALVPMEQREGVRRRALSMWALLEAHPAEVLPAALREPVQLPGRHPEASCT